MLDNVWKQSRLSLSTKLRIYTVSSQPFYTGLTHGPSSRVMVNGYRLSMCNVNDESYTHPMVRLRPKHDSV